MKKKNVVIVLLLFVLLVTGCQMTEETEPVQLSFVHGWGGTQYEHSVMNEIFERFHEQHEEISLNSQPSSDSVIAIEKANDMLALDEMPNIVNTHGQSYYVENAMKRGKLLDLMPYIEKDPEFKEQIHPLILKRWTNEGGSIYTVPDVLEAMGYWYNETYFKEAGIVDENGDVDLPETWDEFYQICEKLEKWNEKSGKLKAVYALENAQVVENLFFARLGGEDAEGLAMVTDIPKSYDTESFRRAVKDFANIYRYSENAENLEDARAFFAEGATAMYFNGVWESGIIRTSGRSHEIAYANYPTNYGSMLSYVSPSSGYVIYNSPNERENEAAVSFLKYMLSEEIQTEIATKTGQVPSNPNVDNQAVILEYPELGKALEVVHSAEIQLNSISSVWSNEVIELLSSSIEKACVSDWELEQFIQKLEETIKNKE